MSRSILIAATLASACAEGMVPLDAAGLPIVVSATDAMPAQPLTVTVDGAIPNTWAYLVRGTAIGSGPCPPALRGACLGVTAPAIVASTTTDPSGFAQFGITVPASVPVGASLALQVVQPTGNNPQLSAAAAITVQHPNDLCDHSGGGSWSAFRAGFECDLMVAVNDIREQGRSCGIQGFMAPTHPVAMHDALQRASRVHSWWMADTDTFSHNSPGGPLGDSMGERAHTAGYDWSVMRENLARGPATPTAALGTWLNSDGHCDNLMDPGVFDLGAGVAVTPTGREYWTLMMGALR